MSEVDAPEYWEARYAEGRDGWELGQVAPPLAARLGDLPAGRAIVPGCGRGHEVVLLAELGHDVVGVDFAAAAVEAGRAAAAARGVAAGFVALDWFTAAAQPGWAGGFDLLVEHRCLCAIDPARRDEYVDVAAALLRPGGRFLGLLLYREDGEGGPPWSTHPDDMRRHFARRFDIDRLEPATGGHQRRSWDWLIEAHRR